MYVYIYIEREREIYYLLSLLLSSLSLSSSFTPSPPTKSLDFRGFDSSKLLILKGGNSHVRISQQGVSRKVRLEDS